MPTHAERRNLPHTPEHMFNLVSDVEKYPEFLPWCVGVRVKEKTAKRISADMMIGYKMFREKFSCKVNLTFPDRIDVIYEDGPFKYLNNHWIFMKEKDGTCTVDFFVDFEFLLIFCLIVSGFFQIHCPQAIVWNPPQFRYNYDIL